MTCIGQNNLCVLSGTYTKVFAPDSTRSSLRSLQVTAAQFISTGSAIFRFWLLLVNYTFQFLLHGSGDGLDDRTGDENCDNRTGSKCAA